MKQQLPPPIGTRRENKTNRPGVKAGVAPKPRRPAEEIEADRQQKAQDKQKKDEQQSRSTSRAAEIEDELRREDERREQLANHPLNEDVAAFRPRLLRKPTGREKLTLFVEGEEQSDGEDEYQPPGLTDEEEDSTLDVEVPVQKPRKRKTGREDITNLRATDVGSGEQSRVVNEPPTKKQKSSLASQKKKSSAFVKDWKPRAQGTGSTNVSQDMEEDDSMVQMGGFAGDDEDDIVERDAVHAAGAQVRGRKELPSMVKISSTPFVPRTQKELRGGRNKWSLVHLPDAYAQEKFSDTIVLLAKQKAGTLAPWGGLSVSDVQEIVDATFGPGQYPKVVSNDAWTGLIAYRLNDWRAGFVAAARNALRVLFSNDMEAFPNEEAIKDAVKWYTKWHGKDLKKTAAYQWREWTSKTSKKGFCQSALIIETFAMAHLTNIYKLPKPTDGIHELPVSALILSLQAVEHVLNEYKTGSHVINKTSKGHFSADNYGDKLEQEADENGRPRTVMKPWATRYVPSIKKFDESQWKSILESAQEYLDALPPRRGRKSRSSSQASSSISMGGEEEILFESDVEEGSNKAENGKDPRARSQSRSPEDSESQSSSSEEKESASGFRDTVGGEV
ncbi:hypothetical protein H0H93_002802 [Arthromyces matolae]|nr:hypothetical protein H0H93_002802 [Arthromyces matolae]